jgi:hypothetical protein
MAQGAASSGHRTRSKQRPNSLIWLQGLLCGAVATLATPTALLLGVLLAPALLATVLDQEPARPRARSIALCGMAASVGPLRTLWISGHSLATASALLGNVQIVGTAWSAAAGGWLLAEITPLAVRAALEALSIARTSRLEAERARLTEAWGLDAASEAPPRPDGAA